MGGRGNNKEITETSHDFSKMLNLPSFKNSFQNSVKGRGSFTAIHNHLTLVLA